MRSKNSRLSPRVRAFIPKRSLRAILRGGFSFANRRDGFSVGGLFGDYGADFGDSDAKKRPLGKIPAGVHSIDWIIREVGFAGRIT